MFTGIVEELGTVEAVLPPTENEPSAAPGSQPESLRVTVRAATVLEDVKLGDSISVNGCCLTVADIGRDDSGTPIAWTADVMRQTLELTSLRGIAAGSRVNLERAAALGSRLGGHLVQGHVDGVGRVLNREPGDHWELVTVSLPDHLSRYLVDQGSITVDGVSLTVVTVEDDRFTVSLIPETLARTTLGTRAVGDSVNLEVDVIAKYVERLLARPNQETA